MAKAPAAIAVSPVASPSRPSVRFTALELPVTTTVTNSTYRGGQNGSNQYLNRGTCVDATGWMFGASGQSKSSRPSASPNVTWPASFQRATSPCDLPRTILRKSSTNPIAPIHRVAPMATST